MSCQTCNDIGSIETTRKTLGGDRTLKHICLECGGTGNEYEKILFQDFTIKKVDEKLFVVHELGSEFNSMEGAKAAILQTIKEYVEENMSLDVEDQYPNVFEYIKEYLMELY